MPLSIVPSAAEWSGSGSLGAKLLFVTEAYGGKDADLLRPLTGSGGEEFWNLLGAAQPQLWPEEHARVKEQMKYGSAWVREREGWMAKAGIAVTNVFNLVPYGGQIASLCGTKAETKGSYLPPLSPGKYLKGEYFGELQRLQREILACQPNLIVPCGNTATWACLQVTNIGAIRGTVADGRGPALGVKCLPTYHPVGVLRNWAWRPIVIADIIKAFREAQYPEIRRPQRQVLVDPTLVEIATWTKETLQRQPRVLSVDIETHGGQITCVGFARSSTESLVIPFTSSLSSSKSYWPSIEEEMKAWEAVKELLECDIPKLGQNFIYDLQYLTRYGILPKNCYEDTMLLHHALYSEMPKGLGFLGSIYTNEASWKLMRKEKTKGLEKDEKKDE